LYINFKPRRQAVPRILRRLALTLLTLALIAVISGLAFLKFVVHKIATTEQPPHLVYNPPPAPDLVYRTLNGQPVHLASTKGKVVFLDLWGTWCIQCIAEMPTVQQLYNHYKNDPNVEFLIVSRMDSPAAVRSYARRNHLDLPFYTTHDHDIPPTMQLHQFPSTFLYARDGRMVAKHTAAADWSDPSVITFIDSLKTH
jgi:thiol-disulfide isomerase/thioredoxin